MSRNQPFPVDPVYTGITLAYRNTKLIADSVLPRVQVGKKDFRYLSYNKAESYTVPETLVGRKGRPGEVEFTGDETPSFTFDYGLDDVIPNDDIIAAKDTPFDPRGRAVEGLTDLIMLDREIRTAGLVFNTSSYDAGNQATLSGTSQWSDFTNSNPVDAILAALDVPIYRPNTAVFGQAVWTKIRQNPKLVSSILGNAGTNGAISRQQFADFFELDDVLIGSSYVNVNKPGQTQSLSRVWGKNAALIHVNKAADTTGGITFGFTAQYQKRISGSIAEPTIGLRGAERVRVGESLRELVVAKDVGYYFQNAIA